MPNVDLQQFSDKRVELTSKEVAWVEGPAVRLAQEGAIAAPKSPELWKLIETMVYCKVDGIGRLVDYRDIVRIL